MYKFSGLVASMNCLYLGVLMMFLFQPSSFAREISIERFTNEDGLPHNHVTSIIEDQFGYFWIGTQDGLARYDGYQFKVFRSIADDPNSLAGNFVNALFESDDGKIWIGTLNNGLCYYDPSIGYFVSVGDKEGRIKQYPSIRSIVSDPIRKEILWIATIKGLQCLDTREMVYIDLKLLGLEELAAINIANVTNYNGGLWIGTYKRGLFYYDILKRSCEIIKPKDNDPLAKSISFVKNSDDGGVWIGTATGLYIFNSSMNYYESVTKGESEYFSWTKNRIYSTDIYQGNIWIGTTNGLFVLNSKLGNIESVLIDNNNTPLWVYSLCSNQNGDLLIGFRSQGLGYLGASSLKYFRGFSSGKNKIRSITYNNEDDSIWLGTDKEKIELHKKHNGLFQSSEFFDFYTPVNAVVSSGEHSRFYVATGQGLVLFDENTGSHEVFKNEPEKNNSIALSTVRCIAHSSIEDSRLWIGTWAKGVNLLQRDQNSFIRFPYKATDGSGTNSGYIYSILDDGSHFTYIATATGGLNVYDQKGKRFLYYTNDANNLKSISSNKLFSLFKDRFDENALWIGTDRGLNRFDLTTKTFESWHRSDGFVNEKIFSILQDDDGILWLGTGYGIARFNPKTGSIKNFDTRDGLVGNDHNPNAVTMAPDGTMFFGTTKGYTYFHPKDIVDDPIPPKMVIQDFYIKNKPVPFKDEDPSSPLTKNILVTDEITLTHEQNIFSFGFAALHFARPDKNKYRYKLENFNDEWIETTASDRKATYTNLSAGNYTFRVQGANKDGVWSKQDAVVKIRQLPPPWLTIWAKMIYALIILGLIYYYLRTQKEKLEQQRFIAQTERKVANELRRVDGLKDEFLANTSHELRTPLHGMIGLAESLVQGVAGEQSAEAHKNLAMIVASGNRLAKLVDDILDFSKLSSKDIELHLKSIDLKSITDVVLGLSQTLIGNKELRLVDDIEEHFPGVLADEDRLQQILYNLVGNGIKFTESGTVRVSAQEDGAWIWVSVTDTGIGIPQEQQERIFERFEQGDGSTERIYGGAGIGLSVTRQLIELHGGVIQVKSQPGEGATFSFSLKKSGEKAEAISNAPKISTRAFVADDVDLEHQLEGRSQLLAALPEGAPAYKVLVVDDEPVNLQVMGNFLVSDQIEVFTANSGDEALELIPQIHPDLVLLDIMMPRKSGFEVCQLIRKDFMPNQLPIIMISAKNQVQDLVEGLKLGANDYLTKPVTRGELMARITTHLNLLKINSAYGRFVPHAFLRAVNRENILDVKLGDQAHKVSTVFFSDIRSYTTLSEGMSPRENFEFLNGYLRRVGPIFVEEGGFVNQYYGDGIMAIFTESANGAVNGAIRIQQKVDAYNVERTTYGRDPISVGIGLHTGPLMMGVIGDRERMDTGVVSDVVNSAARVEGLTKFYGVRILISESCFDMLDDPSQYNYRCLGKVKVKGKESSFKIYEMFDGDKPAQVTLKQQTLATFNKGMDAFLSKDFQGAVRLFAQVSAENPEDQAAINFVGFAQEHMTTGVPDDWDGVLIMKSK